MRVARLNSNGGMDVTFDVGAGANAQVNALQTLRNGSVVVAGQFTIFNGVARSRIARLKGDAETAPSFALLSPEQSAPVGRSPALYVNVASQPVSAYQWRFNGSPIESATNAVLRLQTLQLTNGGK